MESARKKSRLEKETKGTSPGCRQKASLYLSSRQKLKETKPLQKIRQFIHVLDNREKKRTQPVNLLTQVLSLDEENIYI